MKLFSTNELLSITYYTLKTIISIRKRKKTKVSTVAHNATIRRMCRQLYLNYKHLVWVIDDDSYFTLTNSEINENDHFYSNNIDLLKLQI